jgi:hypothetical protein
MKEQELFNKLRRKSTLFFKTCLKIKTKELGIIPLNLNDTQLYFNNEIARIKRDKELCRIVVVKARQFGISTLVSALSFWKCFFNIGLNAFTMADSTNSTSNIFGMIKRFYDYLPEELPKPSLKKSNEKLLHFSENDSLIRVGTAGAKQVGRSMTNNLLHCSEVAFWKNEVEILAGLFQTVPTNKTSEIILESTANGRKGLFYEKAREGLNPKSMWSTIFIPWFWHKEYSSTIRDPDFRLTEEEAEIKQIYDLTDEQMYWRRNKINSDFMHREYLFKQEYPACFEEAFITNQNALIPSIFIERARKKLLSSPHAPTIIGVDPARGGDRTVIAIRKGRALLKVVITEYKADDYINVDLAGRLTHLINDFKAERCFIDVGCGYGTIDILKAKGFSDVVQGVAFNQGADNKEVYSNKRTEIFGRLRDWLLQEGGAKIPDNDQIAEDLAVLPDFTRNSNGQWVMDPKEKIIKDLGKSPDIADSIALTFTDLNIKLSQDYSDNSSSKIISVTNKNRMKR